MSADPFAHPALFYRGDREFVHATTAFVREGLAAGEPVAVVVPEKNLALIQADLGADADRVLMLDMAMAGRNPGRIIPAVLRAFTDRHPGRRVRMIGEPIWAGRTATEYPACAQHEALINFVFRGHQATIMCPYDAGTLTPEVMAEAARTHPVIRDESGERHSGDFAPQRAVDGHNRPLPAPGGHESLRFDRTNLSAVRGLAARRARELGFSGVKLDDIRLTVAELGANSLDHGGGSGVIRVWAEAGQLVCEVSDTGHISDPLAGRTPVDPRSSGSRGLLIVNLLSDLVRVHTRPGATAIRVYFDLPPGELALGDLPAGDLPACDLPPGDLPSGDEAAAAGRPRP